MHVYYTFFHLIDAGNNLHIAWAHAIESNNFESHCLDEPEKLGVEAFDGKKRWAKSFFMFMAHSIIAVDTENRAMVNVVTFIS